MVGCSVQKGKVIFIVYNRIPVMFAVVVLPVILSLGLFFAFTEKNNLRYFNGSTRPVKFFSYLVID